MDNRWVYLRFVLLNLEKKKKKTIKSILKLLHDLKKLYKNSVSLSKNEQ